VLFDESNSLVENDARDENFELGLAKKDLLLTHKEGENLQVRSGTELVLRKKGKVTNKQGELLLKPIWSIIRIIFQKQVPKQSCK